MMKTDLISHYNHIYHTHTNIPLHTTLIKNTSTHLFTLTHTFTLLHKLAFHVIIVLKLLPTPFGKA